MSGECYYNHPELFKMDDDGQPIVLVDDVADEFNKGSTDETIPDADSDSKTVDKDEYVFSDQTEDSADVGDLPNVATDSKLVAVIVECRPLPYLLTVIKTVMFYLGNKWSLQVFHGLEHEEELKGEMKSWGDVHFESMGVDNITKIEYNNLLKSPSFWNKVKGEKVLIFQSDAILLRKGIEEYDRRQGWRGPIVNKIKNKNC